MICSISHIKSVVCLYRALSVRVLQIHCIPAYTGKKSTLNAIFLFYCILFYSSLFDLWMPSPPSNTRTPLYYQYYQQYIKINVTVTAASLPVWLGQAISSRLFAGRGRGGRQALSGRIPRCVRGWSQTLEFTGGTGSWASSSRQRGADTLGR